MDYVDRRSLLVGASASVVLSTQIFRAGAASAQPTISIRHDGRILYRYNAKFSEAVPWVLPGLVTLHGAVNAFKGTHLQMSWDSRLAELATQSVLITVNGTVHELRGRSRTKGSVTELDLPLSLVSGFLSSKSNATLIPQVFPVADLSDIGIDTIYETAVRIVDRSGRALQRAAKSGLRGRKPIIGKAWGGELSVVWDGASANSAASHFTHPLLVLLDSIGPGPIPAGARVTMSADADAIGQLKCTAARIDDTRSVAVRQRVETSGGLAVLVLTLNEAIPARSKIAFELATTDEGSKSPTALTQSACVVSLDGGSAPQGLQKTTGRESRALNS